MTAELTNEEIVTNLLLANDFINPAKTNYNPENSNDNLKNFLSEPVKNTGLPKTFSKYSFIDSAYFLK